MQPDDKYLEELIRSTFDRLPEPEPAKLKQLEERLVRLSTNTPRRRLSRIGFWWLAAALAASGAAAWWGGRYFGATTERHEVNQVPAALETPDRSGTSASESRRHGSKDSSSGQITPSSQIYRREKY